MLVPINQSTCRKGHREQSLYVYLLGYNNPLVRLFLFKYHLRGVQQLIFVYFDAHNLNPPSALLETPTFKRATAVVAS